jgi:hypothetical protein
MSDIKREFRDLDSGEQATGDQRPFIAGKERDRND